MGDTFGQDNVVTGPGGEKSRNRRAVKERKIQSRTSLLKEEFENE
jgi:hypothetical protein